MRRESHQPGESADELMTSQDPPESPWKTLAAHVAYENSWIRVVEYAVTRPDGSLGVYGVVEPGDNASVVALDEHGYVYLAGEFNYPYQSYQWTIPTGKVEQGEEPLVAARRELAEEAGITADRWTRLLEIRLSPGIARQVSHIYLAEGLRFGPPNPEGTEHITVRKLLLADAIQECLDGSIANAVSVAGLLRLGLDADRRAAR